MGCDVIIWWTVCYTIVRKWELFVSWIDVQLQNTKTSCKNLKAVLCFCTSSKFVVSVKISKKINIKISIVVVFYELNGIRIWYEKGLNFIYNLLFFFIGRMWGDSLILIIFFLFLWILSIFSTKWKKYPVLFDEDLQICGSVIIKSMDRLFPSFCLVSCKCSIVTWYEYYIQPIIMAPVKSNILT